MEENRIFNDFIVNKSNKVEDIIDFIKKMKKKVVLYGAGYCGYETYKLLKMNNIFIEAVCDDNENYLNNKFGDLQISRIEDIKCTAEMVILITSGFNKKMKQKLSDLALYENYIEIDFGRYEEENEKWGYFKKNENKVEEAYALFEDKKSKDLFVNLVNYRISRELNYLLDCEDENQYFPRNEILDLSKNEIFLDCGAFDGDSIREFLKYTGNMYKKIIALEPSRNNYKKLLENVKCMKNIQCYNLGAYRESKKLKFLVSDAKNSFVSEQGTDELEVTTIDEVLDGERVTFIKMDIEGVEYDALLGARKTIEKYSPVLAISVYHKVEDLFQIILLINKMNSNYKYYLRHYSPTIIETILYAVPNNKKGDRYERL